MFLLFQDYLANGLEVIGAVILFILIFVVGSIATIIAFLIIAAILAIPFGLIKKLFLGDDFGESWFEGAYHIFRVLFYANAVIGGILIIAWVLGFSIDFLGSMETWKAIGTIIGVVSAIVGLVVTIKKLVRNE
jgi:hypothetical protein